MKKIVTIIGAVLFALSFGIAYAGNGLYNGVTDFSGRSHDTFEIERAGGGAVAGAYESSAAGSKRLVEGEPDASRHIHDTFEIGNQGQAKPGMTRNVGGKESSVKAYDTFEIELAK